jgi:DNA gyrase subunit B
MGCQVLLVNYTFVHPEKIEFFEDDEPLHDIDVEEDHSFLIEGGYVVHNSAAGSAKQGRNRRFQAILPFRGKVINAEKHLINKTLENKEIQALISALGVTPSRGGNVPDIEELRYHKVIIMADSDPDGAHIACLMLTFFYKFMRTLIEQGHIYVANPPLFRLRKGNNAVYVLDDEKLEEFKRSHDMTGYEITRFKGLGEMNPDQLAETALNPATRNVVQVTVEDAAQATRTIEMLMGADIQGRKNFLFNELAMSDVML